MKLDREGAPHTEPLAPEDWNMDIAQEGSQFIALVQHESELKCRLSIAAGGLDDATARTALADKARHWIHEYLSRPASAFGSLE